MKAEDVDHLVKEASRNRIEDEKRHADVVARNEADALVYQTEKALHELGDRVPSSDHLTNVSSG